MDRLNPGKGIIHGVLDPACAAAVGIFPPRDVISVICRAQEIEIAVPVHIHRVDQRGSVSILSHGMLDPVRATAAGILPPNDAAAGKVARAQHIHVSVPIYICRVDRLNAGRGIIHAMLDPVRAAATGVLPPGDAAREEFCAQHIHIPVAIDIRRVDR